MVAQDNSNGQAAGMLVLFDLDGTLLRSGNATAVAMTQAFADLFKVADAFAGIELQFAGRTDAIIFREALERHEIPGNHEALGDDLREKYLSLLPSALKECGGAAMPGIADLLRGLHEAGAKLGLVTGNSRRAAFAKLETCGIDASYFVDGAFGDDHEDRKVLVTMALERMKDIATSRKVIMVGDTPSDIAAAKANGIIAAAVATGRDSIEELNAAGADVTFTDFSDWRAGVAALVARAA